MVIRFGCSPQTWNRPLEQAKRKAAEEVRDKAADLLDIYARRAAKEGYAHQIDETQYDRFSDGFPFELTPDQETSIESVITDLRAPRPMDRLVCGDVGFGKTEVAMRAALLRYAVERKCVSWYRQHFSARFESFRDNFADWPVSIEVLSRFKSAKETKAIIERANNGRVDIVVGTQTFIELPNLGLLIIDEEHRFGVAQKND